MFIVVYVFVLENVKSNVHNFWWFCFNEVTEHILIVTFIDRPPVFADISHVHVLVCKCATNVLLLLLAYFPKKMKVGFSNHQSVCVPLLITFEPLGRLSWNLYGGNGIKGDLDAIIFKPIASIILKWLTFKFVRWALLNCGFGLFMFHGNHGNQVVYCGKFG
jgi:hypothetical protein